MTRAPLSLLAAVSLAAGAPAAADARPQMRSVFQDDCLLVQLTSDRHCQRPAAREKALTTMKELGADTIRITIVRDKLHDFGFGNFDAAVNGTVARGMEPFISLTDRKRIPKTKDFGRFVRTTVEHYHQVHLWSLLNEPNLRYFLGIESKRNATARDWRGLFVAGQKALRAVPGHRHDKVLLGELAPRATANHGTAEGPLFFVREFFCLNKKLRPYTGRAARSRGCRSFKRVTADGFAIHPYTNAAIAPPNFRDPGDGVSVATIGGLSRILDAAARRGRTNRMNVWDTEMGFQSNPPDRRAPSPAKQAEYVNWSDWIQYRNPRVVAVSQYELDDAKARPEYNTGLRYYSGKRKPLFYAYRLGIFPTKSGRGFVRVWAQARPGGAQNVTFRRQAGGRGPFRKVGVKRTNASGYVEPRFRGGPRDRWRVTTRNGFTSRTAAVH